jgi:phage recombination protein Bet
MELSKKELDALRQEYASGATDAQFDLWIEKCKRRNLVPVEDIVLQLRSVREWDSTVKAKVSKQKVVFITTIAALLKLAENTGRYRGFVPAEYIYLDDNGNPTIASLVPLPDDKSTTVPRIPWAARVGVKRDGFTEPQFTVCRFWAYAQTYEYEDEETHIKKKLLNSTWKTRGPEQLVKCTKAAALREAFPEEMEGMYLAEEMPKEDEEEVDRPESKQVTQPPPSVVAPPVNQTPAEGKDNPRPGHEATPPVAPVELPVKTPAAEPEMSPKSVSGTSSEIPKKRSKKAKQVVGPFIAESMPVTKPVLIGPLPGPGLVVFDPPINQTPQVVLTEPTYDLLPNKEQRAILAERLQRISGKVGHDSLHDFICVEAKVKDIKSVTLLQWASIFKRLDSAIDDADLKTLVESVGKNYVSPGTTTTAPVRENATRGAE